MMTDTWCFTCRHEIEPSRFTDGYVHEDEYEEENCLCILDGLECQP